ncbi:nuclear transport factor 2 family protein [Cumulibacter soli]|uniref:nuclear transport factor 2 family protein n=1 Tax=Cumulibacter soli TaxID=2546344 RepID=UPI001067A0E3|nr:nuclear transport factor 2 family protein [Cumulibacter soli]
MPEPESLVLALYDACNAADVPAIRALLADDFTHYSLGPSAQSTPIRSAAQLATQAAAAATQQQARWRVDRIITEATNVGVEYTMWLSDSSGSPQVRRGSEWIELTPQATEIAQIRSYHQVGQPSDLDGFDYTGVDAAVRPAITSGAPAERLNAIAGYYDACTAADVDALMGYFTEDVVHYFLQPNVGSRPVAGREHLARYWRKVAQLINARWVTDSIIARGDEAVIEWSMFWNPDGSADRIVTRGMEWYVFEDDLIGQIRSYHMQLRESTELEEFAYVAAGYSTLAAERSALHTPHPEDLTGNRRRA